MNPMHTCRNGIRILCLGLALCGCVSAEGGPSPSLYAGKAANDDSVYYVRVPPARSAAQDTQRILFAAARQVAIRKGVSVTYSIAGSVRQDGNRSAKETVSLDFDQADSISLADRLKVIETRRSGDGIEALVRLTGKAGFRKAAVSPNGKLGADGNPKWVSSPPRSARAFAAVGSTQSLDGAPEAYANADTLALGRLAAMAVQPSSSGAVRIYQAELHGAYIARRWYNASESRWYSLAVLPR